MPKVEIMNPNLINFSIPSLQEIAKLSIAERHKILAPIIQAIAEDVNNDPELDLFSALDGEGIENDGD
jgi:hypothetical protein